ncbi:MAG: ATP-dependent RecD-like DNA helicase [Desulfosarcinaceae bacterium]|nr:ATP-dependent RecD-like DNA helicase [Desulfosarcinaceae bacterium]
MKKRQIDITGRLERVVFHNEESHYTIARFRTDEVDTSIAIVGHLPDARAGARLHLRGCWERHARWGDQFRFTAVVEILPAALEEIRAYLNGGLIPGIGKKGGDLVDHFGTAIFDILDQSPERLAEVKGVGPKTATKIAAAWQAHHAARQLMAFLKENAVSAAHAARLMKYYGDEALAVLKNDPYRVAAEIPLFGFEIADAIVQRSDLAIPADQRAQACLLHLLERAASQGHCYLPQDQLLRLGHQRFDLEEELARSALAALAATHEVVTDTAPGWDSNDPSAPPSPAIYPAFLHHCESRIARQLAALAQLPRVDPPPNGEKLRTLVTRDLAVALADDQLQVLEGVLAQRLAIITGGPGTGKTTLIRSLATVCDAQGQVAALAAPTGRAARLLSIVTGRRADTIHRLLAYSVAEGRFRHDRSDPLDLDILILDEASMLDLPLFYHLLDALPLAARIVLVGDVFQLPSVGPGSVLADLIASGAVSTFQLESVYRQARHSEIVANAHRIRRGEAPALEIPASATTVNLMDGGDFYFLPAEGPAQSAARIVDLCRQQLPECFGLDPLADIQVLTPMHKGEVGTLQLNRALQAALNPPTAGTASAARFRVGDKVLQMRNNYTKEVFNGEVGSVTELDAAEKRTVVVFEGRKVIYEGDETEELSLAYAISIHKSQGSEYPAVVVPLVTQHYVMLQRNLLYTAITRGQRLVVLVGSPKALRIALANDRPMQRRTGLALRLKAAASADAE